MLQSTKTVKIKYQKKHNFYEVIDKVVYVYDSEQRFICKLDVEVFKFISLSRAYGYISKNISTGYINVTSSNKGTTYLHRVVAKFYKNTIPTGLVIDHLDGDSTNNLRSNLRLCTQQENIDRKKKHSRNSSNEWRKYQLSYHHQRNLCIKYHSQLRFSTWKDMKVMLEFWSVSTTRLKNLLKSKVELKEAIRICVNESPYYQKLNSIKEALE